MSESLEGEFSVYIWFPNGTYWAEERFVDPQTAVKTAQRIITSVGGKLGLVTRLIITDGGDFTTFEWLYGKGITFPEPSRN